MKRNTLEHRVYAFGSGRSAKSQTTVDGVEPGASRRQRLSGRFWAKPRGALLQACLLVVAINVAFVAPANAQFGGQPSGGTLGSLLEQLQGLQSTGVLNEFGGGAVPSRVDQARNADPQQGVSLRRTEVEVSGNSGQSSANLAQALSLAQRYCRGELTEAQVAPVLSSINFSAIERDYCLRARELLQLKGYDFSGLGSAEGNLSVGAAPENYVLGIGDQLILTFVGQDNRVLTVNVDREGRIMLPGWQPIFAVGRTFSEVRREVEVRTAIGQLGTEVFVSLGSVRAITVTVLGEVAMPGNKQLTALSTIFDAISQAGGAKKSGSLRSIRVSRGDRIFWVDIYSLIYSGATELDLTLRDGDRISVPTRGPTFAVGGEAQKPGIYEMPEGQNSVTVAEALEIAGGTLRPRGNRFLHFTFGGAGQERLEEHQNFAAKVRDGDILKVALGSNIQVDSVYLDGHVRVPGYRSLTTTSTVSQLLGGAESLQGDPYLLFGVLETTDPSSQIRRLFPLNLLNILTGVEDYALRDGDRLVVLSGDDIRFLASSDVQNIIGSSLRAQNRQSSAPDSAASTTNALPNQASSAAQAAGLSSSGVQALLGQVQSQGSEQQNNSASAQAQQALADAQQAKPTACLGLRRLAGVLSATAVARYANAARRLDDDEKLNQLNKQECPAVYDRYGDLLPLALEHLVAVNGAVRRPGAYPVAGNISLTSLVTAAGGLTREVDLTRVEVARSAPDSVQGVADSSRGLINIAQVGADKVMIGAGDIVRFNQVFLDRDTGPVYLAGEFVRPGHYEIRRGERLSELVNRAGGLTEQAYPYGAIFTREPVKRIQQIGFQRAARELSSAIAVAAVQNKVDVGGLLQFQQFAKQLDSVEALGRVVIEADPTVLQVRPELDVVLQPGDRLYMPKRPNFVVVIGDVLNPGAMQFISGNTADTYIRQAGGLQRSADEDRIFVVYPNGAAEPLAITVWNYNPVQIPPGSTIVIPKDPAPLDLLTLLREGAQVVGQLAVTAASLAVISRD